MVDKLEGKPTNKTPEQQYEENLAALKKSIEEALRVKTARLWNKTSVLEANQRKAQIPPNFLGPAEPFVKSFDDMLEDLYPGKSTKEALEIHMGLASQSLAHAKFGNGMQPALHSMAKSFGDLRNMKSKRNFGDKNYKKMMKSWADGEYDQYADFAKSFLGTSSSPGDPGAFYNFLEENLSRMIQRIMLSNDDATALQSIPTAITPNIVPEVPRLKTYGVGYGKHTMGFGEGKTAVYGGGQLMDRLTNTLVQRGIRCAVTEMLLANKQKLINLNPLTLERELRILEFNLGKNHNLLYGDKDINKDGTTVLEVDGMLNQMLDATTGYPAHVTDWNGAAFSSKDPLNIFREVAEKLIVNGHLPGGVITGKYTVIMDYGVSNNISTVVDEKQRIMVEKYEQAAMYYGQNFAGFVTDLGTFMFKRSKTVHLTANDTWTPDADISKHAITWPDPTVSAIPLDNAADTYPKDVPVGNYTYRVSVVNDHGESDVSDAFVTTSDGSTPAAVGADEVVTVSIAYNSAFAGGTVNGYTVSPARYFLIYRGNAGETDNTDLKCIAKVPINGVSTTTYIDYNQKIPGTTDMFFISNNPLDIAHISLTPAFEIPLYDINYGATRQWMIMDIAGLAVWAPQRNFIVRNVPGFTPP